MGLHSSFARTAWWNAPGSSTKRSSRTESFGVAMTGRASIESCSRAKPLVVSFVLKCCVQCSHTCAATARIFCQTGVSVQAAIHVQPLHRHRYESLEACGFPILQYILVTPRSRQLSELKYSVPEPHAAERGTRE